MEQLHKCFENKHYPNLKEYVSQFGNISKGGSLCQHALPGVSPDHWVEITFAKFVAEASPESLILIEFIDTHKRLPNWIKPFWVKSDYSCK